MKKLLLASTALVGLTAGAFAADLPRRSVALAPAPVAYAPAPAFSWTGFYVGVSGGYLWNETDAVAFANSNGAIEPGDIEPFGSINVESDGFIVGGTVGGNVQFGTFVAGIEADLSFTDIEGHETVTNDEYTGALRTEMDAFGTLRGRLGVAFDRFMIYGTGGLAFADIQTSGTTTLGAGGTTIATGHTSDDWQVGWTAGVGAEWAFTNNLTFKIEWLHYEFDDVELRVAEVPGQTAGFVDYNVERSGDLIRGGINFKF